MGKSQSLLTIIFHAGKPKPIGQELVVLAVKLEQSGIQPNKKQSTLRTRGLRSENVKRFVSWSGGKDSTASIILCHEQCIPIDGVVMSEVMFDHSRNISGEHPEHINWVYEVAIPKIERDFGYKVIVLKSESDYVQEFYHKIGTRSKHKDRVGKYAGFFLGGLCVGNDRLKMQPLRKFFKEQCEHEQIVGIAVDEPKRLARLTSNKRSVLAEFGVTEKEALEL